MKKILHISKFYPPYYGGIEDIAYAIVEALKTEYEQRVICFNHDKNTKQDTDEVDILRINTSFTIASQPISIAYRKELKKQIKEFRPDYIHLHLPNPLVAAYLLSIDLYGAKIVSHWHSDILGQKYIYPFYKGLERKLLKKSYKIIATSEIYALSSKSLRKYFNKTFVLPNIVNEEKFTLNDKDKTEIEKIKEQYKDKKIIFFVGRHVAYKGIEYLIKSAPYLDDDCMILIGGNGELTNQLKDLANPSKKIKFIGKLSNNELRHYLYASTVFAFPSITRQEAFGIALAEALYCGLPAVSFHIEGSGTIWVNQDNHTGIVVKNKTPKDYAEGLNKLLRDEDLRLSYSQNAKKWVKQNFLKQHINTTMKLVYK